MTALDITGSLTNAHFVVRKYADDLRGAIDHLPITQIANAIELIVSVLEQGQTVFIVGNGGSATTAQHMAADICSAWNDLGRNGSVNCLNDNVARWSALVNDYGPDEAFAGQLRLLARPGDLLITISVSAESSNLLAALYTARASGLTVGTHARCNRSCGPAFNGNRARSRRTRGSSGQFLRCRRAGLPHGSFPGRGARWGT